MLRDQYGFMSLSDVDWFMYNLAMGFITLHPDAQVKKLAADELEADHLKNKPEEQIVTGFWTEITDLISHELHTLDRGKPFKITHVKSNSIEIEPGAKETAQHQAFRTGRCMATSLKSATTQQK